MTLHFQYRSVYIQTSGCCPYSWRHKVVFINGEPVANHGVRPGSTQNSYVKFIRVFYRRQTKLRKGNIFTPICQSFCSQGGCTPPTQTSPGRHPLSGQTPLPNRHPPDGQCNGWYASYWNHGNAFMSEVFSEMYKIYSVDHSTKSLN